MNTPDNSILQCIQSIKPQYTHHQPHEEFIQKLFTGLLYKKCVLDENPASLEINIRIVSYMSLLKFKSLNGDQLCDKKHP